MRLIIIYQIILFTIISCSFTESEDEIQINNLEKSNISNTVMKCDSFNFEKYYVKEENIKKAELNLSSHPLGSTYKTRITQFYNSDEFEIFGGHYILAFYGAGMGLTLGAMVDIKTGDIYELPLTIENSLRNCTYNDESNILYRSNSNLFVSYRCDVLNDYKLKLTYYKYLWDGQKFKLIGTKECIKIGD